MKKLWLEFLCRVLGLHRWSDTYERLDGTVRHWSHHRWCTGCGARQVTYNGRAWKADYYASANGKVISNKAIVL